MSHLPYDRLPGMNALFLDFIQHRERVADLYPSESEIGVQPIPHRKELCQILRKQNETFGNASALPLIDELEKPDTFCTITGQQVGLLTGPLYTIWKALTAIHLAEKARREQIPCIPVFWMATEDHNLHEISSFGLLKENLDFISFSLQDHLFIKKQPAGQLSTEHPEVRKILLRAFQWIRNPEIASFYSKSNLSTAFARTLLWLLKGFKIVIVDPSEPELKKLARPFFEQFFRKKDSLLSILATQNNVLRSRNYPVQVAMEEGFLPLFKIQNQERVRLPQNTTLSSIPIESLSPSALLRPLFQDYLFPTLSYTGGPAEIAYFAQLHPWYPAMEMKQPRLKERASLTLLPQAVRNFLESRQLAPNDCFLNEDTLADALIHNPGLLEARNHLKQFRSQICNIFLDLKEKGRKIDETLVKSIENSERKLLYQTEKIDRKFFLAAKRSDSLLLEQMRKARHVVYPEEKLQERSLNIFSFSSRLPDLIPEVNEKIDWTLPGHLWVPI